MKKMYFLDATYQQIPKTFSEISKIESVKTSDKEMGVIFDSPEEITQALMFYNNEVATGDAYQDLINDVEKDHGRAGVDFLLSHTLKSPQKSVEKIVKGVLSGLNKYGSFGKSFDQYNFEAMGTKFVDTTIDVTRSYGKYCLSFKVYKADYNIEEILLEKFDKSRALIESNIDVDFSNADNYWFNIKLDDTLKEFVPKDKIPRLIRELSRSSWVDDINFEYMDQMLSLGIRLNTKDSNNHKMDAFFRKIIDNNIVGRLWERKPENMKVDKRYYSYPNYKIGEEIKVYKPSLHFSVSIPDKSSLKPIIYEDQILAVKGARDYIANIIQSK